MLLAAVDFLHYLFIVPLCLVSVFLILVILVQRGRGGGLTGALGGMGGASAFGTKAGDLFTRITIGVAAVWILLSMAALKVLNQRSPLARGGSRPAATTPADDPTPDSVPARKGEATGKSGPGGASSNAPAPAGGKGKGSAAPSNSRPSGTSPAETSSSTKAAPAESSPGDSSP